MLRIDGAYLYELGASLRQLARLGDKDAKRIEVYFTCLDAKEALKGVLYTSVFSASLRACQVAAQRLLQDLDTIAPPFGPDLNWDEVIPGWRLNSLKELFPKVEAVLTAELQGSAIYYASPKGGYDPIALTDAGEITFPPRLGELVPAAVADIRSATRCIAFDLPTAAAFHLHRANEAVVRAYFDHVAGSHHRPSSNNMGEYLNVLTSLKKGDQKVISVLKAIKDLHRNPIMHPDQSIGSIDEALSLLAAVRVAIGYMLHALPQGEAPVVAELPLEDDGTHQPTA